MATLDPPIFMFDSARQKFRTELEKCVLKQEVKDASIFSDFYKTYIGADLEKRTVVDQTLRDLVRMKIEDLGNNPVVVEETLKIVSCGITVAKSASCSLSMPFILLGDILDCLTLDLCDQVFTYIEEGVSVWKSSSFYNAGKNYLLRMCNDLLRRLSQSRNTVFCGRIQLFLARLFPLDEKSALNLVSQFNLENVTVFNKDAGNTTLTNEQDDPDAMEVEINTSTSSIIDYKLYSNIWNLQDMFRYPVQCYTKELWEQFVKNSESVMRVLSSYKIESTGGGNSANQQSTYKKSYFPKFLTSEKLSDLQLSDRMFRRQIFVQFLILFRYLTGVVKFKGNSLVLNDAQRKWISDTETKIHMLMEETPPHGKKFTAYVKHMLGREDFWVTWKNRGCPSFMRVAGKNSASGGDGEPVAKRMKINKSSSSSIVDDFINDRPLGLGSPELTKLWAICPDNFESCRSLDREYLPSLEQFFSESAEQEDPINQIEDQYKLTRDPHFQWKGLRLLSNRSQLFFTSQPVQAQFKSIPDYLGNVIKKISKDFPKPAGAGDLAADKTDEAMEEESPSSNGDDAKDTDVLGGGDDDELNEPEQEGAAYEEENEENNNTSPTSNENDGEVSSEDIDAVAEKCGENWKKLAQLLQLKAKDMKEIEEDSDDNVMRARQTLVTWQDYNDKSATKSSLLEALVACGLDDAVKIIK